MLKKRFDFGSAAFSFPESDPRGVASGSIFSTASGKSYGVLAQAPSANPSQPGATSGGGAHLDQFQAYEKRSDKASLRMTITKAVVDAIDANHALLPSECPSGFDCKPIRGVIRFKARAYAESAGGDFFRASGVAYIEGHEGRWTIEAATSADSRRPLWDSRNFSINDDVDDAGTKSHAIAELAHRLTMNVPLSSLRDGELFAVHVRLDAETLDRRGRESAVEAFIQDPQKVNDVLVKTTGLKARGAPAFHEPPVKALPAATCPAGSRRKAGRLQLSAPAYVTDEATGVPLFVLVAPHGSTRGEASATVRTSAGSAQRGPRLHPDEHDGQVRRRGHLAAARRDPDPPGRRVRARRRRSRSRSPHPHCARLGKQQPRRGDDRRRRLASRAAGQLHDRRHGRRPPGSGLVLDDIGTELAVGNGPFTFPGTRADGLPYDVAVKTQPSSPDQVCTVSHGAGTVTGADVTDVAVHCAPPAPPAGLDPTFGSDGRVSTPVGAGEGRSGADPVRRRDRHRGPSRRERRHRLRAHAPRRRRQARHAASGPAAS